MPSKGRTKNHSGKATERTGSSLQELEQAWPGWEIALRWACAPADGRGGRGRENRRGSPAALLRSKLVHGLHGTFQRTRPVALLLDLLCATLSASPAARASDATPTAEHECARQPQQRASGRRASDRVLRYHNTRGGPARLRARAAKCSATYSSICVITQTSLTVKFTTLSRKRKHAAPRVGIDCSSPSYMQAL